METTELDNDQRKSKVKSNNKYKLQIDGDIEMNSVSGSKTKESLESSPDIEERNSVKSIEFIASMDMP